MKYRIILEVVFNDGTDDKVAIYTCNNEDEAIAGFHRYMGQYVGLSNVEHVNVIAKNSVGGIYKNESWTRSIKASE